MIVVIIKYQINLIKQLMRRVTYMDLSRIPFDLAGSGLISKNCTLIVLLKMLTFWVAFKAFSASATVANSTNAYLQRITDVS